MPNIDNVLNKCRDVRSNEKYIRDIEINNILAKEAILGFCSWVTFTTQKQCLFDYYEEKLWKSDEEINYKQDADVYFNNTVYPFEIKTTRFTFPDEIFIRPGVIFKLKNTGTLLLSEKRIFCTIRFKDVVKFTMKQIPQWGDKKCFVLPRNKLVWKSHLVPLDFKIAY